MSLEPSRRGFLQTSAAYGALGLGNLGFLSQLRPLRADQTLADTRIVRFSPEIEPLVRLIEDSPRERLLEAVAERIRRGTTYREVLAALQLAGIRNVQPRPSVGFKFHAVLVVNSAHLAAMNSRDEHRWLPIFWALDYFKDAQARDVRENNWTMPPVDEAAVPPAHRAKAEFVEAMESWDEAKADAAVVALVRSAGDGEIFELLCQYGARDFRSIGHKAIFVANGWRTLQTIGRQHAEPILRSLAYALLNHEGADNPAKSDYEADRPGRKNMERVGEIRDGWQDGRPNDGAVRELLATFYAGTPDEVCDQVVELLNRGVAPQSIWDAMFLQGGELLMRQPGIVGLHTLTTTNALHYAYATSGDERRRLWLLLQNAAFLPMFREAMFARGKVQPHRLLELEPAADSKPESASDESNVAPIFAAIGKNRLDAARRTLAYANGRAAFPEFMDMARLLVFAKGRDSHDYKFSSAVLEDCAALSPTWRSRYLAAAVFNLPSATQQDNPLVERARAALAG